MKYVNIFLIIAFLHLGSVAAFAEDSYPGFTVKGFGTLGASGTDTSRFRFRRDIKQSSGVDNRWGIDTDSRLGLQLDVDINQSWHATAQWVARNNTGDFFEQNLDWLFLRWRPVDDLDIRLGRLGFDVFMLSENTVTSDLPIPGYVLPMNFMPIWLPIISTVRISQKDFR